MPSFDVIGIGVGPSNLSLAALLDPISEVSARFLEANTHFAWHPGLMLPDAAIQISFLKDLVTPVDPQSRYSFLAFLAAHKRLYRFIHAGFDRVLRWEFDAYFAWVARSLSSIQFSARVEQVSLGPSSFLVEGTFGQLICRDLVVGTGMTPLIPPCAAPHLGARVFHAHKMLDVAPETAGRRIVVVGGGQTGAEIIAHLLADERRLPARLTWISRRSNFLPLDESPFTNELFTPAASAHFYTLPAAQRTQLLAEHKLASDGISMSLLETIYRRIYEHEFRLHRPLTSLRPGCTLTSIQADGGGYRLEIERTLDGHREPICADAIILATGFEHRLPSCLESLRPRLRGDAAGLDFAPDFSVAWDAPAGLRLFVQNGARHARGIADPNLSLTAWRAATIANSLARRPVYDLEDTQSLLCEPRARSGDA